MEYSVCLYTRGLLLVFKTPACNRDNVVCNVCYLDRIVSVWFNRCSMEVYPLEGDDRTLFICIPTVVKVHVTMRQFWSKNKMEEPHRAMLARSVISRHSASRKSFLFYRSYYFLIPCRVQLINCLHAVVYPARLWSPNIQSDSILKRFYMSISRLVISSSINWKAQRAYSGACQYVCVLSSSSRQAYRSALGSASRNKCFINVRDKRH